MQEISFSQQFMRKLELLKIASRRRNPGIMRGEQRSPRYGSSIEFADYREYSEGDDIRYIDWNAYARFEDMYLKLFVEEEDINLFILLDVSRSMSFGEPAKAVTAKMIAGALCYVALSNFDHAAVIPVGTVEIPPFPLTRGKGRIFQLLEYLRRLNPDGEGRVSEGIRTFLLKTRLSGVAVLISDFLYEEGYEEPLRLFGASRFQTSVVQILSRDEISPPVGGDLKFIDSENGVEVDVTLNRKALRAYMNRVNGFISGVKTTCRSLDMSYIFTQSGSSVEDIILRDCRKNMIVK